MASQKEKYPIGNAINCAPVCCARLGQLKYGSPRRFTQERVGGLALPIIEATESGVGTAHTSTDAPAARFLGMEHSNAPGTGRDSSATGLAEQRERNNCSAIAPTPIKLAAMMPMLASYPNQEHARRLISGYKFGFP